MQNDPRFIRGGRRFRGNIKDTEKPRVRYSANTFERFNEGLRDPFALLLDNNAQTTSPPEQNPSTGSS